MHESVPPTSFSFSGRAVGGQFLPTCWVSTWRTGWQAIRRSDCTEYNRSRASRPWRV